MIERAPVIIDELEKFNTEAGKERIARAQETVTLGKLCVYGNADAELSQAKALPKSTKQEKEIREDAIKLARLKKQANRLIGKYGIDNIYLPAESVNEEIQSRETSNFAESLRVRKELNAWAKAVSVYERATKPYTEAELLLTQAKHYSHLEALEERAAALGV